MGKRVMKTFKSRKLGLTFDMSPRQQGGLERMAWNNNHTEVRIRLAELFFAPQEILDVFKGIKKRSKQSLSFDDMMLRMDETKKLNKFIFDNWGEEAETFALSVQ